MISSISNWFTDQKLAIMTAAVAFTGFIGPGLFNLSPPNYFLSQSIVIEHGGSSQGNVRSIAPLEPSSSNPKKMAEQPKVSKIPRKGPAANLDGGAHKGQSDVPDISKKRTGATRSDNLIIGDMAQLSKPIKPTKPAKTPKGPKSPDVEPKPKMQAVRVTPLMVPRTFVKQIPTSHQSLSGSAQKDSFLKIALPLILAGNEEVISRREAIWRANQNDDRTNLEKWAHLYDIKITDQDNNTLTRQLLKRADTIPVPIALAQAAIESGWGTSRFAIKGNALFGQWAWRDDAGLRPLASTNDRAVVRSFVALSGSVRAYIHNLNTHPYYENFRSARAALHDVPKEKKTKFLVKHLDRYAEIGPVYVTKLENLIRTNQFGRYAFAYLY